MEKLEMYLLYLDTLAKLQITDPAKAGVFLESRFLIEPAEAESVVMVWLESHNLSELLAR